MNFRNRLLTPAVTTHLFVRQVLEGNVAVPELRRIAKLAFADSSYCDARQRLSLAFLLRLNAAVLDRWLGVPSRQVLGQEFRPLDLFRA